MVLSVSRRCHDNETVSEELLHFTLTFLFKRQSRRVYLEFYRILCRFLCTHNVNTHHAQTLPEMRFRHALKNVMFYIVRCFSMVDVLYSHRNIDNKVQILSRVLHTLSLRLLSRRTCDHLSSSRHLMLLILHCTLIRQR